MLSLLRRRFGLHYYYLLVQPLAAAPQAAEPSGLACRILQEPDLLARCADAELDLREPAVRAALAAGDLAAARRLLGRPYAMSGRVAHGEKLGRELGFPTANIVLRRRPALGGIFVVECRVEDEAAWRPGVASVGRRPTVNPTALPLLEVHLLDFAGELYRRHLQVRFVAKLRDEEKYDDLGALRAAIARDAAQARSHFAKKKTNA